MSARSMRNLPPAREFFDYYLIKGLVKKRIVYLRDLYGSGCYALSGVHHFHVDKQGKIYCLR